MIKRLLIAATLLGVPGMAAAQTVDCTTLPNPVYLSSTTIMKPFYARVAAKLRGATGAQQMTLVYKGASTCAAYGAVTGNPITLLQGTGYYWELNTGTGQPEEKECTFPNPGVQASLAVGDVTYNTCTGTDLPTGFSHYQTFAQGFGYIVPLNSTQTSITAEEAYFIYAFGAQSGKQVPPWDDPAFIVIRNPNSSTQLTTGFFAGISGTRWSANLTNGNSGSGDVMTKVARENTTGNAEKTIGIMATEVYDVNRDKVKLLAAQAKNQDCLGAVYPDSTATSFDKKNLRDGHYEIFGYTYLLAASDANGEPTDPAAKKFKDFIVGTAPINGADPIVDGAKVGSIHLCAMKVKRAYDGAPIEAYDPPAPCHCAFENAVSTSGAPAGCTACTSDATCGTGKCRFGFCEAK